MGYRRTLTCRPVTCPTSDPSIRHQRLHIQATCSEVGSICRLPVCHNTPNTSHSMMCRTCSNKLLHLQRLYRPTHLLVELFEASLPGQFFFIPIAVLSSRPRSSAILSRMLSRLGPDISLATAQAIWRLFGVGAHVSVLDVCLVLLLCFSPPQGLALFTTLFRRGKDMPRFNFDCASHADAVSTFW